MWESGNETLFLASLFIPHIAGQADGIAGHVGT